LPVPYCSGVSNATACELEGVPSAFARLKQQNVDSETGEVVSRDDMVRGYEVAKNQYMIVEDQEIEAVQIESTRTIEIDQSQKRDR
jgi:non-homologous end joining protein Ku